MTMKESYLIAALLDAEQQVITLADAPHNKEVSDAMKDVLAIINETIKERTGYDIQRLSDN